MKHSKIIKDERGTVIIEVKLNTFPDYSPDKDGNFYRYDVYCFNIPKGKRNERDIDLSTDAEKQSAKNELWEKIKP